MSAFISINLKNDANVSLALSLVIVAKATMGKRDFSFPKN